MRESEKFVIIHNWMKYVCKGINSRSGTLAVICSFCRDDNTGEYTKQCNAGTEYLRKQVGCSRRQIFRELHYLQEAGYIIGQKGKSATDVVTYSVNIENCKKAMQEYDEQCKNDYDKQSQAYDEMSQAAYDKQSQAYDEMSQGFMTDCHKLMTDCHPIKTPIKTSINNSDKRERDRAQNAELFIQIPNHEEIKLTEAQRSSLQRDVNGTGRSLESYFRSLEKSMKSTGKSYEPHFETLRDWMQRDKDKAEQSRAGKQRAAAGSSIDMQEVEQLMNPQGIQPPSSSFDISDFDKLVNNF